MQATLEPSSQTLYSEATAHYSAGRFLDALAVLEQCVAAPARDGQDGSRADALNLAGACALAAGAPADAQRYWLRAAEARPAFAQAH